MNSEKVYVGGLPDDATVEEVSDAFRRYGRLRKVWIARRPPGFGFVEFYDLRDAEDAVRSLDGSKLCGCRVRVEFSTREQKRYRDYGRRGPGGYGQGGPFRRSPYGDDSRYGSKRSPKSIESELLEIMVMPRFELAFRRTLFYFLVILAYLFFGAVVFRILPNVKHNTVSSEKQEKLDFERAEFLNILWAESLARSESDWSLLANQKLDSYERSLAESREEDETPQPIKTFFDGFHHSFLLLTTIGGIDTDDLSTEAKVFSIFYSLFGIPLVLLYLSQCVKALSSFWQGIQIFGVALGCVFVIAVLYDIVEQSAEDTPFLEAIFSVFLAATTIGEEDGRVPRILLYIIALIGIPAFNLCFYTLQREVEKKLQSFELSFSNQVAQFERYVTNEEKNDNKIIEEDEEAIAEDEDSN
ncbi:hypothetical protein FO519_001279 [Halicephalobus sp. NKZ332]|nr:hypothetical protein FO519_001279 [Halicephalobus sp. NKZ332]